MVDNSIPSISVAVVRRGEIIWEEGFGLADRENRIPATPQTMYYMASISKLITATSVMMLRERNKLNLDHPVNDYLGTASLTSPLWNPDQATVKRLATHTSGLTTFDRHWSDSKVSADEMIRRYGVLVWTPGEKFDYSNLGYAILGETVARVSGKSFRDFLNREVFRPLGMRHASLGIDPRLAKYAAPRYRSGFARAPDEEPTVSGASGVYCSAHDLALLAAFHLKTRLPGQKAILSDASIDLMQKEVVPTGASGDQYGWGWWVTKDLYGYESVLAQGGTNDASTWLRMIPSEGIAVIVLANTGDAFPPRLVHAILSELLPTYGEKRAAAEAAAINNQSPSRPMANLPSTAFVGDWTGFIRTYRGDIPLKFSISKTGDVQARLGSEPMTPLKNARFSPKTLGGRMPGNLGATEDTGADPYDLQFSLNFQEGKLYGAVTTQPRPEARQFTRLSYWVELKRE